MGNPSFYLSMAIDYSILILFSSNFFSFKSNSLELSLFFLISSYFYFNSSFSSSWCLMMLSCSSMFSCSFFTISSRDLVFCCSSCNIILTWFSYWFSSCSNEFFFVISFLESFIASTRELWLSWEIFSDFSFFIDYCPFWLNDFWSYCSSCSFSYCNW